MRLGLIIYGSLNQNSGGYLYDRILVNYLRRKGHTVKVISLRNRNYVSHFGDNFSGSLVRKLSRLKLDALLEDELCHPSLFILNGRLKKQSSLPIISIVHHLRSSELHSALPRAFYRRIERRYLNSVNAFIFNSRTTEAVVRRLARRRAPSVVARPAGDRLHARISATAIHARAHRDGPLRVLFLGSLTRRKAPHVLIEAMAEVPLGTVSAVFAGGADAEPGYARGLHALARNVGQARQVKFMGHLSERELTKHLRASQVLVVPSSYEGYGIAYLEGMGFGLPAIGTWAGAAGEIITHGADGFLIPVGDAKQLAAHLRRLHTDRDLLAQMGVAARRTYLHHPTWRESMASIEKFLSAYNPSLSRAGTSRRKS